MFNSTRLGSDVLLSALGSARFSRQRGLVLYFCALILAALTRARCSCRRWRRGLTFLCIGFGVEVSIAFMRVNVLVIFEWLKTFDFHNSKSRASEAVR